LINPWRRTDNSAIEIEIEIAIGIGIAIEIAIGIAIEIAIGIAIEIEKMELNNMIPEKFSSMCRKQRSYHDERHK
jgi:hypothetical protein